MARCYPCEVRIVHVFHDNGQVVANTGFYTEKQAASLAKIIYHELAIADKALNKAIDEGLEVPWQVKSYLRRGWWKSGQLKQLLND